jgi:hypothetical protein
VKKKPILSLSSHIMQHVTEIPPDACLCHYNHPKRILCKLEPFTTVCLHWSLKLIFAVAKQISTLEIAQQVPEKKLIEVSNVGGDLNPAEGALEVSSDWGWKAHRHLHPANPPAACTPQQAPLPNLLQENTL